MTASGRCSAYLSDPLIPLAKDTEQFADAPCLSKAAARGKWTLGVKYL